MSEAEFLREVRFRIKLARTDCQQTHDPRRRGQIISELVDRLDEMAQIRLSHGNKGYRLAEAPEEERDAQGTQEY